MHIPHSTQASVARALPLTSIAPILQKEAHWPHPTQLSFVFMRSTSFSIVKRLIIIYWYTFVAAFLNINVSRASLMVMRRL
jgi:hypothetical protein